MSSGEFRARRKLPIVPVAAALAALAAVAVLVLRGMDYRAVEEQSIALVRSAGPWAFFAGAALLPAIGAPLSFFTILSGELFAPRMTLLGVIAAMFVAIAVNLALTYWLARYALRPLISRLAAYYGYGIPKVTPENALSVALVVRLTPGPPYFLQSYILGMAEMPFGLYMVVSWLCQLPWGIGFIVLGKGLFNGNFKMAIYGVGLIVVATVVVQQLRKRYASRVH
jgi:uncharacterized membrane protein YdjX (TVP38/TMEM64 family)